MSSPSKKRKTTFTKRNFYAKPNRRTFLEVGNRGFFATCNFREKDCVRECYNLLNQYADELYGPEHDDKPEDSNAEKKEDEEDEEKDISEELNSELEKMKHQNRKNRSRRFIQVSTEADNCVFIKTTLEDPVELGMKIFRDIDETKKQKSRFLLRLIPIETVCLANLLDIVDAAGKLCDKYFLKEPKTFSIVYNRRYNNSVGRDEVIEKVAEVIASKNIKHKVDLKGAELSVVIEVIKGLCCIAVAPDYFKLKKYNLMELCDQGQNHDKGAKKADEPSAGEPEAIEKTETESIEPQPAEIVVEEAKIE